MSQKYYNQNSTLLDPKCVRDYVSPDGMWAVVPCIGDKEWVIIHNGSVLSDVSRTFQSAMSKVEKYKKRKSGSQVQPKPPVKRKSRKKSNSLILNPCGGKGSSVSNVPDREKKRGSAPKQTKKIPNGNSVTVNKPHTISSNPLLDALS